MNPKYKYEYELYRRFTFRHIDFKDMKHDLAGRWDRVLRSRSYENIMAEQTRLILLGPEQYPYFVTTQEFQIRKIERKKR